MYALVVFDEVDKISRQAPADALKGRQDRLIGVRGVVDCDVYFISIKGLDNVLTILQKAVEQMYFVICVLECSQTQKFVEIGFKMGKIDIKSDNSSSRKQIGPYGQTGALSRCRPRPV